MRRKIAIASLLLASACGRGYSDGDRSGFVVKISSEGLVCKTWEGSMHLAGNSLGGGGSGSDTWDFTVYDPALVPKIQEAAASGKRVTLHYVQWVATGPCQSDTDYEVTGVSSTP